MPMDIYSTGAIRGVVRALVTPSPFLVKTVFRNAIFSQEEEILFDVEIKRRRISPLVAPHVPGKLVAQGGYRTDRFTPATIKDKRALNPKRPIQRMMGEQIGGAPAMSPAQRSAAILNMELQDQVDMAWRRFEVMAADALVDGIVTVTGDGYPSVTVDFQRPAGHTVTLAGASRWGQAGISPVDNLATWSATFLKNSGLAVTDVVFCVTAWGFFQADPKFVKAVDTTLRGSEASGRFTPTPMEGAQLVGVLNSNTRLWLYSNWFVDPADDTEKVVLDDNSVVLFNDSADGAQSMGFGAIQDEELGYPSVEFAAKSWTEKDPAQRLILGQSAPLTILSRPAATFYAKVN